MPQAPAVAGMVGFLAGPGGDYITGQVLSVDGSPTTLLMLMTRPQRRFTIPRAASRAQRMAPVRLPDQRENEGWSVNF